MALKHVNAVVVGGGAVGGIVAKELAEAGLSVVLLERGKWSTPFDDRKDDLRNQRTCVLGNSFGPDERNPRVYVDAKGQEHIVPSNHWAYSNNAACVGGGTLSYGAMAWRFMEDDFRLRTKYGTVAGSTLDDWPITYWDNERYYEKAEWKVGVSGDDSNNIFRAPRKRPLPMPPLPPNRSFQILEPAAKRLGPRPDRATTTSAVEEAAGPRRHADRPGASRELGRQSRASFAPHRCPAPARAPRP